MAKIFPSDVVLWFDVFSAPQHENEAPKTSVVVDEYVQMLYRTHG